MTLFNALVGNSQRTGTQILNRKFLESLGFKVELIAMDKEYYQKWIFKYLDGKNITYIVLVRESKKLKGMKEAALKNPKDRVQTYEMQDD
ncbi:MAG: hypothetical protein ACTSR8_17030 [Promethearchaeota archaeon]